MQISQSFFRMWLLILVGAAFLVSGVAVAQTPPGTKAPVRKNLFNRTKADYTDPSGRTRKPDDILRATKHRKPPALELGGANKEHLPDFRRGDIRDDDDQNMQDLQQEEEDFLNPEWLKPVDPAGEYANENLEQLGGELTEGEQDAEQERLEEERMDTMRENRRDMMREISGQKDPFEFLENNARLASPERKGPATQTNGGDQVRPDGMGNNRAQANLNKRDTEKFGSAAESVPEKSNEPAATSTSTRSFANASTGSLIDGMALNSGGSSMLDSINKKYGNVGNRDLAGQSAAKEALSSSRMRRAFVERDGGVDWRSDLRTPERRRPALDRSLPGNGPVLGRPSASENRLAGLDLGGGDAPRRQGGILPSLRLPTAGLSSGTDRSSVATIRIGGNSKKSMLDRSSSTSKPKRGFDLGPGLKSGFDNDFIRNPGKF